MAHGHVLQVLIGDIAHVRRGLGSALLRRFSSEFVFSEPDVEACVIDPHEPSTIATEMARPARK